MVASNLFLCGQWCNDELSSISCCHCGGKHRLFRSGSVRSKGKCTLNFGNIVNWFLLCLCHFNKKKNYFWLCWVFVAVCGLFPVVVCKLLTVMASCVEEHGLQRVWASEAAAHRFRSVGSVDVAYGLSCPATCGIFLDQGLNLCHVQRQADSNHWTTREAPWLCHFSLLLTMVRITWFPTALLTETTDQFWGVFLI